MFFNTYIIYAKDFFEKWNPLRNRLNGVSFRWVIMFCYFQPCYMIVWDYQINRQFQVSRQLYFMHIIIIIYIYKKSIRLSQKFPSVFTKNEPCKIRKWRHFIEVYMCYYVQQTFFHLSGTLTMPSVQNISDWMVKYLSRRFLKLFNESIIFWGSEFLRERNR